MDYLIELFRQINIFAWNKLILFWLNIWYDKILHFLIMIILWLFLYLIFSFVIKNYNTKIISIILILFFIWIGKEIFDLSIRNTFISKWDLMADLAWIGIFYMIIKTFFKKSD